MTSRPKLEFLPPDQIRPNPKNPRRHSKAQVRAIADSILAFGFNAPVIVDRSGQLIVGHGRFEAARLLALKEIPVVRLDSLTDNQARAYMLADNKLTDRSGWDEQSLALHLKELSELTLEFDLEATGFEMPEIDLLIQSLDISEADSADEFEAPAETAVTRPGDLWHLGEHRLLCGDALNSDSYTAVLGNEQAAAVFTDFPYNLKIDGMVSGLGKVKHREFPMARGELSASEFTDFLGKVFGNLKARTVPGALIYGCMDWRHCRETLEASAQNNMEPINLCVWTKTNGGMGSLYRSKHELVWVFRNGTQPHRNNVQLGRFGRNRTNVWTYPGANVFGSGGRNRLLELHPTVKPVALVADAILDSTVRRDIVLDPFLGSGTTLLAAERTGRRGIGIELDPAYVDTAILRWQKLTGKAACLSNGQSHAEIAGARARVP